ncbi:MAG TPA: flippase [Caldisericia bacterium]|nr:flippase [Caldisericia bacterium]
MTTLQNVLGKFLKTTEKRRLAENFLFLSILQGLNYVLPLITFPYLVRVLGPEKFGLISFAQAFVGYLSILTDYGFNLSATRDVSINRDNKQKINEIFSSVMIIKFFLCIISFLILSICLIFIPKFRDDWVVYIFTFFGVIGQVLFPVWFFQGMEKMRYITILNVIAKTIFVICIFVFIKKMSDYLYVPLINSLGYLNAGLLSLWVINKNFAVKFILPKMEAIRYQLKEGWHIFISTVAISLYTTSNTFILGLFTNNTIVGYYAAAEKIVRAIQGLLTPVSQVLYPFFAKVYSESKERGERILKKILKIIFLITLSISIVGSLLSENLSLIILGEQFTYSAGLIRILVFIIFAIGVNNILGIQGLIAFGFSKYFRNIVFCFGVLHIFYLTPFIIFFEAYGVAIAVLFTEIFIAVTEYIVLRRKKIL